MVERYLERRGAPSFSFVDLRGEIERFAASPWVPPTPGRAAPRPSSSNFEGVDYINPVIALIVALANSAPRESASSPCNLSTTTVEIFNITRLSDFRRLPGRRARVVRFDHSFFRSAKS